MRVLHVQNLQGIGGSENYLIRLLPELRRRGVEAECAVIYNRSKDGSAVEVQLFEQRLTEVGVRVHKLEVGFYLSPAILAFLRRIWQRGNFDLLHSHLIYADFWAAWMRVLSLGRITTVSTIHGYQEKYIASHILKPQEVPRRLYWFTARFNQALASATYVCSEGLRTFYEKAGFSQAEHWPVIEHGFDFPEISGEGVRYGEVQIAVVGRLIRRKGIHLAIEAFGKVYAELPGARLVIVGRGEESAELKSQAAQMGLGKAVVFTGFDPSPEVQLKTADLLWVPSFAEGLPLIIFESFHAHTPVVAFDTVGCRDMIEDGKTGVLAKAFDTQDLAQKSIELLRNPEGMWKLAEAAGQRLASHYSLDRMVSETIQFYQRITGEKAQPGSTL